MLPWMGRWGSDRLLVVGRGLDEHAGRAVVVTAVVVRWSAGCAAAGDRRLVSKRRSNDERVWEDHGCESGVTSAATERRGTGRGQLGFVRRPPEMATRRDPLTRARQHPSPHPRAWRVQNSCERSAYKVGCTGRWPNRVGWRWRGGGDREREGQAEPARIKGNGYLDTLDFRLQAIHTHAVD